MAGQFIGVGVGPGDPELITLKAARLIQEADVISFIANEKGESQSKNIAADVLADRDKPLQEIPLIMPMCDDRSIANSVYDKGANAIQVALNAEQNVVFLCEGDPLFFGSFTYLLERLENDYSCQVVPGISSVHAASSTLGLPLTLLKESFAVISGRHSEAQIVSTLQNYDSVVIMKAGRSREKILAGISTAKRLSEAKYLEYIGREGEHIERDVTQLKGEAGPYFSLFVITKAVRDRS